MAEVWRVVAMASYIIRGGEEGKARLGIISEVLEPSSTGLLRTAGIAEGFRCLDVGCGGGNTALSMARIVGPTGRVVGIDMDPVKMSLAARDAAAQNLTNVEFRTGDATALDEDAEYDLVYARVLLTHLADPDEVLARMVRATKPGGPVVLEDLDHTAVFCHPRCAALERYVELYNELSRRRGGDPEIGPKLVGLMRRAGLEHIRVGVVQPVFLEGQAKRIHQLTLDNIADAVLATGLADAQGVEALKAELDAYADDPDTMVSFPRIFQVIGRRPQ
jgi:ubiquinone/menaquinone biosynthesis C-methylase UbiE